MPAQTLDSARKNETALKQALADKGGSLEREAVRELKKKVRRAQRKRRRLDAAAQRQGSKKPEPQETQE